MNNVSKAVIGILLLVLAGVGYLLYSQNKANEEYKVKIFKLMEERQGSNVAVMVEDAAPEVVELTPVDTSQPVVIPEPPTLSVKQTTDARSIVIKQAPSVFQAELRKTTKDNTYKYDSIQIQGEPYHENTTLSYPVTLRFKINGTDVYYSCKSAEISYDLNDGEVTGYIPDACFIP